MKEFIPTLKPMVQDLTGLNRQIYKPDVHVQRDDTRAPHARRDVGVPEKSFEDHRKQQVELREKQPTRTQEKPRSEPQEKQPSRPAQESPQVDEKKDIQQKPNRVEPQESTREEVKPTLRDEQGENVQNTNVKPLQEKVVPKINVTSAEDAIDVAVNQVKVADGGKEVSQEVNKTEEKSIKVNVKGDFNSSLKAQEDTTSKNIPQLQAQATVQKIDSESQLNSGKAVAQSQEHSLLLPTSDKPTKVEQTPTNKTSIVKSETVQAQVRVDVAQVQKSESQKNEQQPTAFVQTPKVQVDNKQIQVTIERTQNSASKDVDLAKTIVKDDKAELSHLKPTIKSFVQASVQQIARRENETPRAENASRNETLKTTQQLPTSIVSAEFSEKPETKETQKIRQFGVEIDKSRPVDTSGPNETERKENNTQERDAKANQSRQLAQNLIPPKTQVVNIASNQDQFSARLRMDLAKTASASSGKDDFSSQHTAQNNLDAKVFAERSALGLLATREKNTDLSQFKTSESNLQIGLRGTTGSTISTSGSRVSLPQNAHVEQRMAPSQHAQQNAAIIGEKINKMISGKVQNMSIQLEPANLGKLNINIQMGQDQQASVQFLVQVGQTRELVEQALPRLRDMLASQGIALGDTQIDQQNSGSKEQNFGQQFAEQHKSQDKHNPISRSYTQMESMIQDTVTSTQDIQEDVHNPYQNNGRVKIDFYA